MNGRDLETEGILHSLFLTFNEHKMDVIKNGLL
jgi:hypothetical protein